MRLIIIAILLSNVSWAQMSFSEVDKTTYTELMAGNYSKVIAIGEKALKEGHDFLYLNYRLGIAHYQIGNLYKAEALFIKVFKQNPNEEGIKQYLSGTYQALGMDNIANLYLPKTFNHALTQSGIKQISNSDLGENMLINSAEVSLNTNKHHKLTLYYTHLNQNVYWGNYNQNQLFIGNDWTVSKNLSFGANLHYINLNGSSYFAENELPVKNSTTLNTPEGLLFIENTTESNYLTTGDISQNNYLLNLNSKFKINNVTWTAGVNAIIDDNNDSYFQKQTTTATVIGKNDLGETAEDFTNTIITDSVFGNPSVNLFQLDISTKREFGSLYPRTILNGGVSIPFTLETTGLSVNGSVFQKITKKAWLGLSLVKNQNLNAILQEGKIVNNGLDLLNQQFGIHWQFYPTKKWSFNIDYQKEIKTEFFTREKYNYNTLLGTIKYNF